MAAKDYLTLPAGISKFEIINMIGWKIVHFIRNQYGNINKVRCVNGSCQHCMAGERRSMRFEMLVRYNHDKKTLECGPALANQIINFHVEGDTVKVERIGTGIHTRYNVRYPIPSPTKPATNKVYSRRDRDEGIRELIYDLQRSTNYDEKHQLIKDFADEF